MVLLTLLTTAVTMTAPAPSPWACELAPTYGQGHADEGRIDDISTVGLSCGYRALQFDKLSLWPVIGANTQNWTIYRDRDAVKEVNSYNTQDIAIGGRASYALFTAWDLSYEVMVGRGRGNLKKILSTDQSTESQSFDHLQQTTLSQSLGVERQLTQRLSLSFAVQRLASSQSWNAGNGDFSVEQVDADNHLSLTGGPDNSMEIRDSSRQETTHLKVGLRMYFD